ncbi:MAG: HAD family hydrolase [Myxococcales bacterium]|nr:HAD family hydrolase [Myxococcales bacterium]
MSCSDSAAFDFGHFDDLIEAGVDTPVFDIDNTLTRSHIGLLYLHLREREFGSKLGFRLWYAGFRLLRVPYYAALDAASRTRCQARVYGLYDRYERGQLETGAQDLFDHVLRHRFIRYIHDLVLHLQLRGVRVVLLSTNLDVVAQHYGAYFGVEARALPLATIHRNARRLDFLGADFKGQVMREFDPRRTLGVADSRHDLPVFRHADHSLIVTSRMRGWMRQVSNAAVLFARDGQPATLQLPHGGARPT